MPQAQQNFARYYRFGQRDYGNGFGKTHTIACSINGGSVGGSCSNKYIYGGGSSPIAPFIGCGSVTSNRQSISAERTNAITACAYGGSSAWIYRNGFSKLHTIACSINGGSVGGG